MAFADRNTYMGPGGDGSIIGRFFEAESGLLFEFSENKTATEDVQRFILEGTDWTNQFPHKVWVMEQSNPMRKHDQGFRYARVLKTRAHVVVDEDENGPVIEVWKFKNAKREIYERW